MIDSFENSDNLQRYVRAIRKSNLSIYDRIEIGDPNLWIPTICLERILSGSMLGISLQNLPIRTRSKVVKERICGALGYPVPPAFRKTQPRFPGQCFDTYVQKSNNLQVWNESIEPERRYVIIRVGRNDEIAKVKVITGSALARHDTTGTLTRKYQAKVLSETVDSELFTKRDTETLRELIAPNVKLSFETSPASYPKLGELMSIAEIYKRLRPLVGESYPDLNYDPERNRGALLHRRVCDQLGYSDFRDRGQFPDILHQLLEIKLQTSQTIDLGLIQPSSMERLEVPSLTETHIRHCDVRYAVFLARTDGINVTLSRLYLVTGEQFFSRFPQFQGNIVNRKLQIPLPKDFFD